MPLHLFHVFSSFNLGGLEARTCVLMNALGREFRHTITATDGNFGAAERIGPGVDFKLVPPPTGKGGALYPFRLSNLLRAVQPDLLVTYNWGAFDAVLAATVDSLCPVVHTEDGFNPDEVAGLKARRVWSRRLILNQVSAVVMPSRTLRDIALQAYRLRPGLVHWIPNGIDTGKYGSAARERWRAEWGIARDDFLIGSAGRLAPEKNLGMLLRAVAASRLPNVRVVLAGSGPCRPELERLAAELGMAGHVVFPGFIPDPCGCFGAFDLFAMSSTTEQMPIALLEAMAAGLPAICTAVGDSAEILGHPGPPAIVPPGDLAAYIESLKTLHGNAALREQLGARNRARCIEAYSLERMIARYRSVYLAAAGCASLRSLQT
jgi:glycosyltransferase involved in cell wall biosynthesis